MHLKNFTDADIDATVVLLTDQCAKDFENKHGIHFTSDICDAEFKGMQ